MYYERDSEILAKKTRLVRIASMLVNWFPAMLAFGAVMHLINYLNPGFIKGIEPWFGSLFVAQFGVFGFGFVLSYFGFRLGRIKCPCCPSAFRTTVLILGPRKCENCGYDIKTKHRPGDV
jgi:hypothetical protein